MNTVIMTTTFLLAAVAVAETLSPDAQRMYMCGRERYSAAGCFNSWTKLTHEVESNRRVSLIAVINLISRARGAAMAWRFLVVMEWQRKDW